MNFNTKAKSSGTQSFNIKFFGAKDAIPSYDLSKFFPEDSEKLQLNVSKSK